MSNTQMSNPVLGLTSTKDRSCPSADQDVGPRAYSLLVNFSRPPLPSAFCQKTLRGPSLSDEKAILLASGVHTGIMLVEPSKVNRVIVSRASSYTQTWPSWSKATLR